MKINRVTITGADDKVNITELQILQRRFPFVEWGILFSASKPGTRRYASSQYVKKLTSLETPLNLSAHLCGGYPRYILQKGDYSFLETLENKFKRAQINFNFLNTEHNIYHLFNLPTAANIKFILQANKSNTSIINKVREEQLPFDFLYDSSGGRGTEIKEIKEPIAGYYTGYSGGLGPDNIEDFCQQLISHPSTESIFIDCESKVRDGFDEFDLDKVEKYLEICSKYVTEYA